MATKQISKQRVNSRPVQASGASEPQRTVQLGHLITEDEIANLKAYLDLVKRGIDNTTHNIVMKWLDDQPLVADRFRQHGVIKPYGAYLLEYYLDLK